MPRFPIKIVIVGTGLIGPRHAQAVLQEPTAELSCIVDPNPKAQKVAQDVGTTWYSSTKEMLAAGCRPDAAIVCTPNHTHVSVSQELLEEGIHVLVEKPISGDAESAQSLVIMPYLNFRDKTNNECRSDTLRRGNLFCLWVTIVVSTRT